MKQWLLFYGILCYVMPILASHFNIRDSIVCIVHNVHLSPEPLSFRKDIFDQEFSLFQQNAGKTTESKLLYCVDRFRELGLTGFPVGYAYHQKYQDKRIADAFGMICEEVARRKNNGLKK